MARILVISPDPTHPQDAGNRARIFALLSELQRIGHKIHFLYLEIPWQKSDAEAMSQQWNGFQKILWHPPPVSRRKRWYDSLSGALGKNRVLPYRIDDWFDARVTPQVREVSGRVKPDIVIVEYVYLSKILELFDEQVLKILDTHDVMGGRDQLFIQKNLKPQWFYTSEKEEKKGIDRADIILAIQTQEAEYFKRLTKRSVLTIGHLTKLSQSSGIKPAAPPRLLFVGSSNHCNLDGIQWFLKEVFGLLRKKYPEIELDLVGNACDAIKPAPGLNLVGTVQDLAPFYEKATIVINPLQFGTGLKIKTVEALAMKRPLVTTSVGAAGIEEWSKRAFLCADAPEKFASAIFRIIASEELQDTLAKGAREFTIWYNQQVFSPLKGEIDYFLMKRNLSSKDLHDA